MLDLRFFRSSFERKGKETPEEYKDINKLFDAALFSKLCDTLWNDPIIYHAANLVISGMGTGDPLQQGALYSVALEALTNSLGERKSKDLKPISDPELSKSFTDDLNGVLERYKAQLPQDAYTILGKNIAGIKPPNQPR